MTPQEHARWTRDWEDYVEAMERLRDRPEPVIRGLLATLRDIRALPEAGA